MNIILRFRTLLLAAVLTLLCGTDAKAASIGTLNLNEPFTVKNMDFDTRWQFTAPSDGIVKIVAATDNDYFGPCLSVHTDKACVTSGIEQFIFASSCYEFSVVAGSVYYIKNNNWSGQDINAKLTLGDAFAFDHAVPAVGATLSVSGSDEVSLLFTTSNVSFTEGEVIAGGKETKVYNYKNYDALVADGTLSYSEEGTSGVVNWNGSIFARSENENGIVVSFTSATGHGYFNVLNRLFEQGKLQAGDPVTLKVHGVSNALTGELLNGDGELSVTWIFAGAPTVLVDSKLPETIKSWYNAGDPEAIMAFTFSRGIRSARVSLEMGQGEGADDLYHEEINADRITIEGNVVKADLSDVMRTKRTMGLKNDWPTFTVQIYNVVDVDGNEAYSPDLGSAASYSFTIGYKDISGTVSSEITPASGSALTEDTKEIEVWFNNSNLIQWNGVEFVYYTVEDVDDVDVDGNPVTTAQNVAHTTFIPKADLDVTVEGSETTIIVPVPADIWKASNIRLGVNITSSTDGIDHVIAAYYNTSLSHDLDLLLCAEPANESTVSVLKEIYLTIGSTYSINNKVPSPVMVYGKTNGKILTGTVVEDGMTNAKIVLSETITEADTYDIVIAAGVIGDYVYGESKYQTGITNEQCTLTYTVDGKYAGKSATVDPEEGEVKSLSQFTITYFEYASVAPTWNVEAYVEDAEGVKHEGQFAELQGEVPNAVTFTLNEPITALGEYTLVIPAGAVCNGATGDPIMVENTFAYTVVASVEITKPTVDPAEGTYDEIGNILIDFGQPVTIVEPSEENNYWAPQPNLEDTDGGWTVWAGGQLHPTDNSNVLLWVQDGTVVKGCDVQFRIPAGCVMYSDGSLNPDFTYNYTITGNKYEEPQVQEGGDPTVTPEEGVVVSLQHFTIFFNGWAGFGNGDDYPVIKDKDGNMVATAWNGLEYDWDDWANLNKALINFDEEITANGEYTLVVPVVLNDETWALVVNKEYEFHYTIGDPNYIAATVVGNNLAAVYTMDGKMLKRDADADYVKSLRRGLYIINGRKCLVR